MPLIGGRGRHSDSAARRDCRHGRIGGLRAHAICGGAVRPGSVGRGRSVGQRESSRDPFSGEAVRLGIAYVPEDRRRHGVILHMPVAANTTLASLGSISKGGFLQFAEEQKAAAGYISRLGVKTPSTDTLAGNLSGGNQQKVALARWLMTQPKILILDEPTQGIDVGAKMEIYRLIRQLAANRLAILMISSETEEILGMSDRVAVMSKGRIAGILDRANATPYDILELALGHQVAAQ